MPQTDPVAITKKLIQIDSSDPGNYEGAIVSYLRSYLKQLPDSIVQIQEAEVLPGRSNLMAVLPGEADSTEPDLVLISHMDTVPVGNGWTVPPFQAMVKDDLLYGRGACDMKSGLACALTAFADAAYAISNGATLKNTLRFITTIDEEADMRGVEQTLRSGWIPEDALILDTEPTNHKILTGHKGRLWFHLTIHGKAAHASNPEEGADAILGMVEAVSYIRTHISEFPKNDFFGATSVCFGQISGGTVPYAVCDSCRVTIDMRLVPPADQQMAEKLLTDAIAHAAVQIPGIRGSYEITGNRPPIPYYEDSALLEALLPAYETAMGCSPEIAVFTGYTDSAVASAVLKNKNCASFGPGNLKLAHKPDEYVPIQDIIDCRRVLDALILRCCMS